MHRRAVTAAAVAFALCSASSALAAPGDFPEQPDGHLATACPAVVSHNQGIVTSSPTAMAITTALYNDACFGG
jgi:hypothetical protein